jgi:hypothetical protein
LLQCCTVHSCHLINPAPQIVSYRYLLQSLYLSPTENCNIGWDGEGKSVGNCIVSTVSRGPIPLGDALYARDCCVVPETRLASPVQTEIQSPAVCLARFRAKQNLEYSPLFLARDGRLKCVSVHCLRSTNSTISLAVDIPTRNVRFISNNNNNILISPMFPLEVLSCIRCPQDG